MKVSVVMRSSWDGWVLRKIGLNLVSTLVELGVDAEYVNVPNPESDINHFLHFSFAEEVPGSKTTMMITHVDDAIKAKRVKSLLAGKQIVGICMSRYHMEELIDFGISNDRLSYVLPALDNTKVRRIHFTIQCNRYRDGRKNEEFLTKLSKSIDLSFAEFSFFGSGWKEIAADLRISGAQVTISEPSDNFGNDYDKMIKALEYADYYVNLGWDEGSLASLDAFVSRTKMILSAQGYHLNIPDVESHFFTEYSEFQNIISDISDNFNQKQKSADLMSWTNYAEKHMRIWETLISNDKLDSSLNSNYGEGSLAFDKSGLRPILDRSFSKTIDRALRILLRKLKIVKR